ncbi:uncharacterized protein LOC132757541 [Ruditapes philippinarum]|uniref:uncharacterized protein LOC132757541 n=1 Tax=Ruditapes philippinarum TaxID=129788 RepID=UPI00295BFF08|nr:uncharacterized protein LOC132757541 [Ruditapes philippinarum]
MATLSSGPASLSRTHWKQCFLFRLQMLIIDGGLLILRNIFDQKLQNVSLSAFLQQERSTITKLKSRGIITQVQYDLLFPSGGSGPTTTDLDITLIICLLRNIKSFGLNKNFQWNSIPAAGDTSIEADISRLRIYRNELSCISSTSEVSINVFKAKWTEIEQVLLRLNTAVSPIPGLQKIIDDFKVNPLDPFAEIRVQNAIDSWKMLEKGVEADLKLLKMEEEKIKCTLRVQDQTTRKHAQSIDEFNKKTCKLDKQIQELKLKEETRKELKDELITWYNTNQSTVPLSPLTDDSHTPLAGFYIMPEIDIQTYLPGGRKETTRVKSLQDLSTPSKKVSQEIYVSAAAGFGKTSFSKDLVNTWCKAHIKDENFYHFKDEDVFLGDDDEELDPFLCSGKVKNIKTLIESGRLPRQRILDEMCQIFGRKSKAIIVTCKAICEYIKSKHVAIAYVWAAYTIENRKE